jgi:hypothetical protein
MSQLRHQAMVRSQERLRKVNFGDRVQIAGSDGLVELCSANFGEDQAMVTVSGTCTQLVVPAQELGTADYRPMLRITWGAGGSDHTADYDITSQRQIPFPAGAVSVKAWICPLPFPGTNVPIGPDLLNGPNTRPGTAPATVTARVSATICEGQALDESASFWLTQFGANAGQFVHGQCRAIQHRFWCYNTADAGGTLYLLLVDKDGVPANGDLPFDGSPVPANERQDLSEIGTRGYAQGCAWALSSTANVVTLVPDALAFITSEFRAGP